MAAILSKATSILDHAGGQLRAALAAIGKPVWIPRISKT
jgi:hypothetical protein